MRSAIGALNREYRVTVVEDGVTTLWPEIQRGPPSISSPGLWARRIIKQVVDTVSAWK